MIIYDDNKIKRTKTTGIIFLDNHVNVNKINCVSRVVHPNSKRYDVFKSTEVKSTYYGFILA